MSVSESDHDHDDHDRGDLGPYPCHDHDRVGHGHGRDHGHGHGRGPDRDRHDDFSLPGGHYTLTETSVRKRGDNVINQSIAYIAIFFSFQRPYCKQECGSCNNSPL